MDTEIVETVNKKSTTTVEGEVSDSSSSSVVKWEKFLSKMAVRVLLVEADDSTRQIITALLRKCSYRVAAVSDGLKAWELLKARPHNVDLILTEVELPSISGYPLLTLIMEHDVCKNIPVIMMSSYDSVNMVYKCMMGGATDFLVKPIRKNELRNLWQHVWRKQASNSGAGLGPPDDSEAQQKVEATAETDNNNAISNHSSGYMECIRRNREGIDKGSDAQSSCTKPELETEKADLEQPKSAECISDNVNSIPTREEHHQESIKTRDLSSDDNQVLENSSREAIDLIGAFDNHLKTTLGSSSSKVDANRFDILPVLDLSLKRSHFSGSVNQINDEKKRLKHSDASAFSRYKNKPFQPRTSTSTSPSTCNQQTHQENHPDKQLSNPTADYHSDAHAQTKHISVDRIQPQITFSSPQQRNLSHPIPVKGVRLENAAYTSLMPPIYFASQLPSPSAPNYTESVPQFNSFFSLQNLNSQQFRTLIMDQRNININQTDSEKGRNQNSENLDDRSGNSISPANDGSGNNNFCGGSMNQQHNMCSGNKATSECGNEEEGVFHASHRSILREAALMKFRQKRKDRCFEKKVRYESRKKLAEQRPRVKGQFVRQLPNDHQTEGNSSASLGSTKI